ncbi:hypothetical protein HYE53_09455 [Aggregatibacter actinomycetemcomitans]|uniref:hypothetical protein n=1 Tax=Aggregatibacter actinomycetemcomitans TaxID=714 RepID=UPI00197B5F3C|nr:hypothetical protein [Aggregatibacter actinomycetemcomitans]MBN6071297.1 hypothetical protein [Aggregatibacter actinomycetemcomitans]
MKHQFITSLKNGKVPFLESQQAFSILSDDLFEPFNSTLVKLEQHQHRWSEDYFNQKALDLDFNFSKELVSHLIEVKKYLQEKNMLKVITQSVENAVKLMQKSEDNFTLSTPVKPQAVKKEEFSAKPELLKFKPNEKLTKFLADNDVSKIRTYLMSMLNNRRIDLEGVFKSIWYVHQHKSSVFEEAENSAFVQDMDKNEASWNIDYFNQQQVYLNKNFTLDRLLHLVNVRETLMKKGDSNFQQISIEKLVEQPRVEPQRKSSSTYQSYSQTRDSQQHKQIQQEPSRSSQPRKDEVYQRREHEQDNSFIKTVVMIGGAVLALGLALFAIFK